MVRGGISYRQTDERFNVRYSVIVRLKQRVNQTGSAKGPIKRPLLTIGHNTARIQWARDHMGKNIR